MLIKKPGMVRLGAVVRRELRTAAGILGYDVNGAPKLN